MAGPVTAERGGRQQSESGPPRPPRRLARLVRPRALALLALGAVLLGGAALWVLYGSQWLRAERVTVSGTRVLTPAQVRAAADVPLGHPLISVDTDAVEARLRSELPRIASVDVVRSWPHEIGLKVTERTPVLLVEKGGKFIEVDAEGVRFATVSRAPEGVPTLELTASQSATGTASLRRFGANRLMGEAVRVAGDIPAAVARDARVVRVASYDGISLELTGDRTVDWGSGEKGPAKARTLTALMKASPGALHFDVSVPTAPAASAS
ncbi:cell division protein FtsQ [Streptomyces minutiscleroticus]|uniref:Cell division protein FtsQ n=1 Tax=Streptomyces minutiscleroticus TaxID=68238 RepID=A0A918K7P8_9ACTN|nr:FtsQ-type POTRA domain-containing protein [Streptomyces minutiscleroticus]GGX53809.1 cell division protein FtsQ [Streptomyces minutiscleroticus]